MGGAGGFHGSGEGNGEGQVRNNHHLARRSPPNSYVNRGLVCSLLRAGVLFLAAAGAAQALTSAAGRGSFIGVMQQQRLLAAPLAPALHSYAPTRSQSSGGTARDVKMLWSGGRRTAGNEVTVNIERPSLNSRRISGSIIIDKPIEDAWLVLTDYDKLSDYVPNLTQSRTVPHPEGGIRLFQEGAQKIIGFDFRASLTMDMEEHYRNADDRMAMRRIKFKLVESGMFGDFDGEWRLQYNSRIVNKNAKPGENPYIYRTKLFYMVYIRPRGPVPVVALEWQIAEEVPNNLLAVKKAAESLSDSFFEKRRGEMEARSLQTGIFVQGVRASTQSSGQQPIAAISGQEGVTTAQRMTNDVKARSRNAAASDVDPGASDWEQDETLEAYFSKLSKRNK